MQFLKKKRKSRARRLYSITLMGSKPCRRALPSAVVGFYPPSLGCALRRWAVPSVAGFYPRHRAVPSVAGFYPLHRAAPSVVLPLLGSLSLSLSLSWCCHPDPPHCELYALCSSFGSAAHLLALRLVVRGHVVSGGLIVRCSTLRRVDWPYAHLLVRLRACRLACFDVVEPLSMSSNPYRYSRTVSPVYATLIYHILVPAHGPDICTAVTAHHPNFSHLLYAAGDAGGG
jgi:hypothetical protein